MPRPKRSRVNATRPAKAASPTAQESQQSSATPPAVEKPVVGLAREPSSDIYGISDREKERIKQRAADAAKPTAAQSRRTRAPQHFEVNSEKAQALADSRRRRDDAFNRLDNLTSTSTPVDADSPDIEHSRRESGTGLQPRLTDASGLDLDDDLLANLDDSLDDTENTVEETRTGYRSTDTSSFNVALFKRRPRQSSVAGRDDAPIRPSSRGQNTPSISSTLNFGNFRRRAREPSIIGTARKARTQRSQSRASQASRNASVLGDGDDSGPEGESTPVDMTRRRTRGSLADNVSEGSPILPSRKRKSLESHEDGHEKRQAVEPQETAEPEQIHQSIEVDMDSAPPSPPRGRARERERERFSTPVQDPDDPDMAPPLSSSASEGSPVAWPSLDTLAHRTYTRRPPPSRAAVAAAAAAAKTPELGDSASDISSPPSLTHSPNYGPATKAALPKKKAVAAAAQKKVTTADLTSLLPRRRHKVSSSAGRTGGDSNDPFDLDASEDDDVDRYDISAAAGDDDDEVSYVEGRAAARRRNARQRQNAGKAAAAAAASRKTKVLGDAAGAGEKTRKKRPVRTYGSNEDEEVQDSIIVGSGGDEEEEEEAEAEGAEEEDTAEGTDELPEEETSQMMRERIGEELQQAAKKFKEVDRWELSFEEVTEESSPGPFAR